MHKIIYTSWKYYRVSQLCATVLASVVVVGSFQWERGQERESVMARVGFLASRGSGEQFKERALRTKKGKKPTRFTASGSLVAPTDMTKLSGGRFQISDVAWRDFSWRKAKSITAALCKTLKPRPPPITLTDWQSPKSVPKCAPEENSQKSPTCAILATQYIFWFILSKTWAFGPRFLLNAIILDVYVSAVSSSLQLKVVCFVYLHCLCGGPRCGLLLSIYRGGRWD